MTGEEPRRSGGEARELAALSSGSTAQGMAAAGLAAVIAAVGTVALAALVAVLFPDGSLIGRVGVDTSLPVEAFRQVVQFLQVAVFESSEVDVSSLGDVYEERVRAAPALLAAVPLGLSALGAATQARRTRGTAAWKRILWGAATGLPFSLAMLLCAVAAGSDEDVQLSVGAAFGAGLGWGAAGGALGAAMRARAERTARAPDGAAAEVAPRPALLHATLDVLGRGLRPLAVLFVVGTLIATGAWVLRAVVPPVGAVPDRSPAVSAVENALYAVEHGTHFVELGSFVQFEPPGADLDVEDLPFPPDAPEDVSGSGDRYRIFAYGEALPPYLAITLVVVGIGLVLLTAAYAGFSVVRGRGSVPPLLGVAWGAVVGPLWAVAVSLADLLIDKPVFGQAVGGSAFASVLLIGTVLGAAGGALAAGRSRSTRRGATSAGRDAASAT